MSQGCGTLSIGMDGFFNLSTNSTLPQKSNFRAFQNLVGEHSIAGVPASLYNLTKSVPDPLTFLLEFSGANLKKNNISTGLVYTELLLNHPLSLKIK